MRIKSAISFQDGDAFVSSLCNPLDPDDILRQAPSSLLPAALEDKLKLLSPRTFIGMIDLECKRGSISTFDVSTTARSAKGLLLPLAFVLLLRLAMVRRSQSVSTTSLTRMLIAIFGSPWCLQCIHQLYYQLSMPLNYFRTMVSTPALTLSSATEMLRARIMHQRAYRTRRYDVYLPSSLDNLMNRNTVNTQAALLFIPGATISHEAYSEVAARLSDEGFVVAVMSLEPFRLASRYFGANLTSVKRIMNEITRKIHRCILENLVSTSNRGKKLPPEVLLLPEKNIEWTLMGHSMGAFGAMKLFRAFLEDPWNNQQKESFATSSTVMTSTMNTFVGNKLAMWGVAAFVESATDLSDLEDAQILILQGTNDVLVEMKRARHEELEAFFPKTTSTECIVGGTHEGFSSCQVPTSFQSKFGGKKKRPITLDEQHKRACQKTTRFLSSR